MHELRGDERMQLDLTPSHATPPAFTLRLKGCRIYGEGTGER